MAWQMRARRIAEMCDERCNIVLAGIEKRRPTTKLEYTMNYLSTERDVNIVTLHGQEQEYGDAHVAEEICLDKLKDRGIDYLALGTMSIDRRKRKT